MSYCEHCQNTGYLDCYCGGDLCICDNNGEYPCPYCEYVEDDGDDDYGPEDAPPTDPLSESGKPPTGETS